MTPTILLSSTKLISQLQKVGQPRFSLLKPILTAWFLFFMYLEMFTGKSFFIIYLKWDWPTCISLDVSFCLSCTLLFVTNCYQLLWLFKDNWNRTENHIDKDDGVLLATAWLRDLTQLSTMVLCSDFKILLSINSELKVECDCIFFLCFLWSLKHTQIHNAHDPSCQAIQVSSVQLTSSRYSLVFANI